MDTESHTDWIANEDTSLTRMISPAQHAVQLSFRGHRTGEPKAKFFY